MELIVGLLLLYAGWGIWLATLAWLQDRNTTRRRK